MDVNQKDNFGFEKDSNGRLVNNNQSINAGDWRFGNPPQPPMSLDLGGQIGVVDSFCPNIWDHSSNSLSVGFSNAGPATNDVLVSKPLPESSRVDMGWNHTDYTSKGAFLQPGLGVSPREQPEFPADSAFIERAAKYSCFGSGNYVGMINSFGINEFLSPYSDASRAAMVTPRDQSQKNEATTIEEANKNRARSPTQSRVQGIGNSDGNEEATEAEFGGSGPDETPKTLTASSKRKRPALQEAEFNPPKDEPVDHVQTPKDCSGSQSKDDQKKSTSDTTKQSGKNVKDGNDDTKEDYIHVRARRGQATNSHSLAERVRREKISERMKFLQDLVPGCTKVTGKAVMLDEIINYVQSLQRQVEFLSMKLSTVNPHLDVNIEGIFSKDILQSHVGSSSGLGFSPDSLHPFLHQTSQGLVHPGGPTDMLRRAINSQLTSMNTYRESKHQVHNEWDDELQNVPSRVGLDRNLPQYPGLNR